MRRTQIYLDDDQTARLDRRAASEGTSRSTVIRLAVDEYLEHMERDADAWRSRWSKVIDDTAGIAPYLVEGSEYVEELRSVDAARLSRLEP